MDALAAIGCQDDADIRLDEAALHLAAADRTRADLAPTLDWLKALSARLPAALPTAQDRAQALSDLLVLLGLGAFVTILAGMPIGARLGRRLSSAAFDRVILTLLTVLALKLLWDAL